MIFVSAGQRPCAEWSGTATLGEIGVVGKCGNPLTCTFALAFPGFPGNSHVLSHRVGKLPPPCITGGSPTRTDEYQRAEALDDHSTTSFTSTPDAFTADRWLARRRRASSAGSPEPPSSSDGA